MRTATLGSIRVTSDRVEFCVPADDGRAIEVAYDIDEATSHTLRHLLAAHVDPRTGRRQHQGRSSLLGRALEATGATVERLEVLPGEPARLELALVNGAGDPARIQVGLVDAAELIASHRVRAVAVGWPARDWDQGLRELLG